VKHISIALIKIIVVALLFMPLMANAQDEDESLSELGQAQQAIRKKEFLKAEHICRKMLVQHSSDNDIKHLLSHTLIFQSRFSEADSLLKKVLESDTNLAGTYWYMGLSAERQGKNLKAVDLFKKYVVKTANPLNVNVSAWLHAASGYRRMMRKEGINTAQFDEMLYLYNQYLEAMPTEVYADNVRDFIERVKPKKPMPGQKLIWDETGE
jgi:tetratricopeptide (TPR) repeat protein